MSARGETRRIVVSMTVTCAAGAAILGGVYLGTERYAEASRQRTERTAVRELLSLGADAEVRQIDQYLTHARDAVVYRERGRQLVFGLDGSLRSSGPVPADEADAKGLHSLGRIFAATENGAPAGFVVEGESRGYKNRIRFFVALDGAWRIAGVRVVEHEEDPGLGAEVATGWFQGQYAGRDLESVPALDVTKDPMPEDWRGALRRRAGTGAEEWASRYGALREREAARPIYAVTGATISSRALTDGVRTTILHFRRRWELLEPHVAGGGDGTTP
ncbi:MAG TPA: FMN-binding protein [Acidobacteriota bacterium]|nr:FMN-binding protein [Acidobacteriota bacterium]